MLMQTTISDTPSVFAQDVLRSSARRRSRVNLRRPDNPTDAVWAVPASWHTAAVGIVRSGADESVDFMCDAFLLEAKPAQPVRAAEVKTEDFLDRDLCSYMESLAPITQDEFDDGLADEDFDLNARLLLPPVPTRRIKVKLRFIGKQSPRIHIDPELDFSLEVDEEADA